MSKSGAEGLRGIGILRGARGGVRRAGVGPRHQDRGRRRPRSRARGRRRSRRCARSASSRGRRCASSPATTGRRSSTRTAGWPPRRSRTSTSRRWASSSSDRRHDLPGRPVPDPRHRRGRVAQRDPVRVPAAREAVPPGRGGGSGAAAVPRDPGGVRAARRLGGPAATGRRRGRGRPPGIRVVARGRHAGPGVARGLAGAPGRRDGERGSGRDGRHGTEGRARDGRHGRQRERLDAAARAPRASAPPRERHAPQASRKATPGSTTYDEAKETPLDPAWEGGVVVRPVVEHVLDDQPARVRRPPQARPRVPGARARRAVGLDRRRRRRRLATDRRGARRRRRRDRAELGLGRQRVDDDRGRRCGWGTHGWAYEEADATAAPEPGAPRRARSRRPTTASPARPSRCPTSRPSPAGRRRATCSRSPAGPAGAGGWSSR